jgi:hypothetical protein
VDHARRADEVSHRELVHAGAAPDEVHRGVDMRPGVRAQLEARGRRRVAALEVEDLLDAHLGIARPVHHPIADRDRDVDPARSTREVVASHVSISVPGGAGAPLEPRRRRSSPRP